MSALVVRAVGGPVLVQDRGRPGHAAIGVGTAGAADRASHDLANRLLGNDPGAATLEVVLGGLEVEAEGMLWVCVTGAPAQLAVGGRAEPTGAVLALRPGERLTLGTPPSGLRSYLAVRGGLDTPRLLGSRAHDTLAGLGPAPVRPGERIAVGRELAGEILVDAVASRRHEGPVTVGLHRGPRDDWAVDADALVARPWRVAADSDRVGLRLEGEPLGVVPDRGELPSEGALRGAVQLPPDGRPVVFGPDHPVTGGYPVVAVVADADTDRLSQLRPGEELRFRWA
ncbi:biotin-dependent carboxyltransferase family protein [Nocardioides sp. LML1-1-1.1]|uniref:5-oxoprolinase subunit C family protein n=1 Tax=Nocardioides sp. LML1-1-1.1 TaxID=3135248 RepID=UPI00343F038F